MAIMNKNTRITIFMLAVLPSACGPGEKTSGRYDKEHKTAVEAMAPGALVRALDMPDRPVIKTHLDCVRADFADYFRAETGEGPVPLSSTEVMVLSTELTDVLDRLATEEVGEFVGMRIHHGITSDGSEVWYAPVLSFGILNDRNDDSWDWRPIEEESYTIDSSHVLVATADTSTCWDDYLQVMRVKRNSDDAEFDEMDAEEDVRTYTYHGAYIQDMIAHNAGDAIYIKLISIAEYTTDEDPDLKGILHHCALVTARDVDHENIDDDDGMPSRPVFKQRGLNIGSPCPPNCLRVLLPEKGLDIRKSCL